MEPTRDVRKPAVTDVRLEDSSASSTTKAEGGRTGRTEFNPAASEHQSQYASRNLSERRGDLGIKGYEGPKDQGFAPRERGEGQGRGRGGFRGRGNHNGSVGGHGVHHRVLETALRLPGDGDCSDDLFCQPLDFISATSAGIGMGKPSAAPFQKIDFCLYIDVDNPPPGRRHPGNRTDAPSIGRAIRPDINHTNHRPLRDYPITMSIESKRSINGLDKANLQLAVWQAAQWNFLRWMAGLGGEVDGDVVEGLETGAPDETGQAADIGLPFIPGLVIAGHAWYLTITTNDCKRRTPWAGYEIGSTELPRGVYSIICVLQYLARWWREVYWPWFRHRILGLGGTPGGGQRCLHVCEREGCATGYGCLLG